MASTATAHNITQDDLSSFAGKGPALVTFGETLVRDTPNDLQRLERTGEVSISLAGSEYTLAMMAARLGVSSAYMSRIPDNPYGWLVRDTARSHWTVGATDVNIKENVISGGGTGIAVWDCDQWCPAFSLSPVGTTGTMNSNTLSGQTYGLLVRDYDPGAPVPNLAAHQNSITGSSTDGAWANVALNATDNWWGSSSGPKHPSNTFNVPLQGVNVSNNVTFVPWLDAAPPVGVSFAPVTDTSPVGNFSSIQAGVNASNPGGTVNAAAGTFTENVTVGQEVTIAGAGASAAPSSSRRCRRRTRAAAPRCAAGLRATSCSSRRTT